MEAIDHLKNLTSKFNELRKQNDEYCTYRDGNLTEAFAEANAFLAKQSDEVSEEPKEEVKEKKGKKKSE